MSAKIDRRQILIGAASVAAGAVLPVTSVAAVLPEAAASVLDLETLSALQRPLLDWGMQYELKAYEALLRRDRLKRQARSGR